MVAVGAVDAVDRLQEGSVDVSFRIPDTDGPEIVVRRPVLGGVQVLADGVPVQRSSRRAPRYAIPMPDGTTREIELAGQWRGLRAIVDGNSIPLEPALRPWELGLIFLPAALAVIGGAIGALIGIGGAAINARLFRRIRSVPLRIATVVGVAIAAVALYLGVAVAITPLTHLTVGMCFDGPPDGSGVRSSAGLDCAAPHDNEVIAEAPHTAGGSYPGQQALFDEAAPTCLTAFTSFVGIPFERSTLDMTVVVPTGLTWFKGDRISSCVVATKDRSKLTGSVRGSAR